MTIAERGMTKSERALLDQIAHPVFALEPDADGVPRYVAFNLFARELLGKTEEEILGLSAAELYPGRMGQIALNYHHQILSIGAQRTYELSIPTPERVMRMRTSLMPVRDASGILFRIMGSSTDITSSEQLDSVQAEFETLASEIEDFISITSDELRSPILKVNAIANLLREDFQDLGDGKIELIDMLEDVGAGAMTLISDVLGHVQTSGVGARRTADFDFRDLCEKVLTLTDPQDSCTCEIEGARVTGDEVATQIVLRDLIGNALKHAKRAPEELAVAAGSGPSVLPARGGSVLCLSIGIDRAGEGMLAITLRDHGTGFADPVRLFLGGAQNAGFGSDTSGIRRLISARGGTISATRDQSGGAVVRFTMPGALHGA